jgi:hypothetical protein
MYILTLALFMTGVSPAFTDVLTSEWMGAFAEYNLVDIPVIPGTHQSGIRKPANAASYVAWGWARTQVMTLKDQLENGVRFLDLRVSVKARKERVILSHSILSNLSLEDALEVVAQFLTEHESEGVILLIRRDTAFGDLSLHQRRILSEVLRKSNLDLADVSCTENNLGSIKVKHIAGKALIFTEPNTLIPTLPFLWRSTLTYQDIWRSKSMRNAKKLITTYMSRPYSNKRDELGGVAIDGNFPPLQQIHSSLKLNSWFMDNLLTNWTQRLYSKIGIVLIDFATPQYLQSLVKINFLASPQPSYNTYRYDA